MKQILVGYTGFVGSNIKEQARFSKLYNSKNIAESYGTYCDLLIYAGVKAQKFLANKSPKNDIAVIESAKYNISHIKAKKIVLISTIDVYGTPCNVTEDDTPIPSCPYGQHRLDLEKWLEDNYPNSYIIRLPALFGKGLKKNFIYDMIVGIPTMLNLTKMKELSQKDSRIMQYYDFDKSSELYTVQTLDKLQKQVLRYILQNINFNAIDFTDSRSAFQYYPLSRIYKDIKTLLDNDIHLFNAATAPVITSTLYKELTQHDLKNELAPAPLSYDFRTKYASIFGGEKGYIMTKSQVLDELKSFVKIATPLMQ